MRGTNQHTPRLLRRRTPSVRTVDESIKLSNDEDQEIDLQIEPDPSVDPSVDPLLSPAQCFPKIGIESNKSLRLRLNKEYGNGTPQVQLLINSVVRLNAHARKAKSVDSLLKLLSTMRQILVSLEQIAGKDRASKQEVVDPYEALSDEELDLRIKEFAAILGRKNESL